MNYKNIDENIGNLIYQGRVVKRITQEELTNYVNEKVKNRNDLSPITRQSLSYYEHGTNSIPQGILEIVCNRLGLNWKDVYRKAVEETLRGEEVSDEEIEEMKKDIKDNANL